MDIKKKIKLFSCVAIIIIAIIPIKAAMTYAQTIDQRIGGQDRYETAVRVSQQGWENSSYAVIAGGEDYADALCCGLLAQNYRAPVLLSRSNNISAETLEELKRLGTKYVFIIGGFRVINSTAETQLQAIGIRQIERLAGKDRFETAVKIAEKTTPVNGIILANGQNPWDVLTINTVAVQKKMPILLTDKNNLPPVVKDFLEKKTPQNIYLIGGEEAISNKLEKRFRRHCPHRGARTGMRPML